MNYEYDVTGNVTFIRENGATSGFGVLATYAYDSLGRRQSVTFGNGSVQSFGYEAAARLQTLTTLRQAQGSRLGRAILMRGGGATTSTANMDVTASTS